MGRRVGGTRAYEVEVMCAAMKRSCEQTIIAIHASHVMPPDTSYSYGRPKKSAIRIVSAETTCVQEAEIVRIAGRCAICFRFTR